MNISWKDAQQRPKIIHIKAQLVDSFFAKFDFEKNKAELYLEFLFNFV